MGSKNPTTTTNQSSTYTANPAVQSATQGLVGSATSLSQNPYQAFTGQMVSPTTAQQQTGYGQITQAAGIYAPYAGSALSSLTNLPQYNPQTIQSYMSPYTGQVVQATEQQLQNIDAQQQAQLTGNAISAGAFGGDRAAVASSVLAGQQDLANNSTIAGLYQGAFQNAQGEFNTQQQTGLQTAGAYGNLGTSALTNALTAAGANVQAGTQQQSTQTAIDQANYQLYQNALAYPYQNLSWLSSILGGAGSTLGGTTQGTATTTQTGVSDIGSILGGVLGLGSLFLPKSDERVKDHIEVVGKLFDGSPVYRFRYKGEPTTQIGLMAQDVEKKHPEAVIKDPEGIRHLNYDIATADAAKRKHFDAGGVVIPYGGGSSGIIPLSGISAPMNYGQQMSEAGINSLNSKGASSNGYAPANIGSQLGSVLQNKQAMQGIQSVFQISGLQNAFQNIGNDFSLFSDDAPLIPGGFKRGGIVHAFADGGAPMPFGDLSGVNFDPGPTPSSTYDFPFSVPTDTPLQGVQAAPVMPSPVPSNIVVPPQSAPQSGITAINGALHDPTFDRMIATESGGRQFDEDGSPLTSPKGAIGVAQIMPGTAPEAAALAGVPYDPDRLQNDPAYNYKLGRAYYDQQLKTFGSPELAAAAYNAGPGAVSAALAKANKEGGNYLDYLPTETQNYVQGVSGQGNTTGTPGVALAYDGSTSTGSGLPVQPATASASQNPISGISQFFSGLVPHVSDAERMGLLGAGLGMMASHSPFPGQQIGEGGLSGLQSYMSSLNLQREQAETQADIGYKGALTGQAQIDTRLAELKANQLLQAANYYAKMHGGTQPQGPAASAPITGPTQAGTALPVTPATATPGTAAGAPSASAMPASQAKQVIPEYDPQNLRQLANDYSYANPQLSAQYMAEAKAIETGEMTVPFTDGTRGYLPQIVQAKAGVAGAEAAAKNMQTPTAAGILLRDPTNPGAPPRLIPWSQIQGGNQAGQKISAGAPLDTRLLSPEGAKIVSAETAPVLETAAKNNDAAQSTLYRVADMRNELAQLPTSGWLAPGSGFAERNAVAKDINTSLSMLGVPDKNLVFDANAVASGQALQKLTRTMGFDLARTLGSREAAMIINQAVGTVPSADNTPLGAKRLLSSIEQVAQRQIDWFNYAQQWSAETGGSLLGASAKFNATHPPQQYAARALASTIDPRAVAALRQKPGLAGQFDQKYGPGTAKLILGLPNGQ